MNSKSHFYTQNLSRRRETHSIRNASHAATDLFRPRGEIPRNLGKGSITEKVNGKVMINPLGYRPITLPLAAWEDLHREASASHNYDVYLYWYASGYLDQNEGKFNYAGKIPAYNHGADAAYQLGEMECHQSRAAMGDSYDY